MRRLVPVLLLLAGCSAARLGGPRQPAAPELTTGSAFYATAAAFNWKARDSFALAVFERQGLPEFLRRMVAVHVERKAADGKSHRLTFYACPDYFSVGTNDDWARVPLTPMAAQRIADSLGWFLPTPQLCDDIYEAARVKLTPVPMYAFRDSTVTMWQHHLIIEGQRKGRRGLIAGIKKDVVITEKLSSGRDHRVAIYGWHKPDHKPIQPVYTGHVDWYADYSHGARFIARRIRIDGKDFDYAEVLADPTLRLLLTSEPAGNNPVTRYNY